MGGLSTETSEIKLPKWTHEGWKATKYKIRVFQDLCKLFNMVNEDTTLKLFFIYGIQGSKHPYFRGYLENC